MTKVLLAADPDTQDYLVAIKEYLARMEAINRLSWNDMDFEKKYVMLYSGEAEREAMLVYEREPQDQHSDKSLTPEKIKVSQLS
ncbi:MAG: hypothetical protein PHW74_03745 [Desulfobacca sp.]|nr:hypothetical protein [Desulfobacca sp.]